MSLETAQKVIVPQKKNYVPQFLKQQDINSYYLPETNIISLRNCCWFLKCSEEIHYVPIGDGWEEVLVRNVLHYVPVLDFLGPNGTRFARAISGPKKVLAPSKCPSKWLIKWFSHQKKIISRSFLNSGPLIVIMYRRPTLCTLHLAVDFLKSL